MIYTNLSIVVTWLIMHRFHANVIIPIKESCFSLEKNAQSLQSETLYGGKAEKIWEEPK